MDIKALRRRCEHVLDGVDIPDPFDVDTFASTIAGRRQRPLHLLPKQTPVGPCGVWLAMPEADYVFYENGTSAVHREHIILHELGHLLGEHEAHETIDDDVLRELFPQLDPAMVRRVLGRTSYSAAEEQEAEMIASMVLERVGRRGPVSAARATKHGDVIDRLTVTLGGEPTR
jgi:hypothetical protein